MAEVNARQLLDSEGQVYFPFTHVTCVEGIPEDIADFDIGTVQQDVDDIQSQINNLQSLVNSMVTDTGWINIPLSSGIEAYSSAQVPQARLVTVKGINFLTIRGSVKGVTARQDVTAGTLSSTFSSKITSALSFIQNTSVVSGEPNYSRIRINTNGTIVIERTSIASPTSGQWYPLDCTFMI
ncbi:hypothetical protein [Staphylococcus xylosus]|uniref:hypothetical protein n=1 Tax=Staphylococcus xylosus TaxID=1288 RepID=UPI000734122C|nr:hypothetical protein [Staphylococcus xylosus]